jgi:hypothetical protein
MLHRNVEPPSQYVDDRLSHEEPKSRMQKLRSGGLLPERRTPLLTWLAIILLCYTVSLQEQVFALFTSVRCTPATVRAGTNATCSISTFQLAAETDLSITQLGEAGNIVLRSTAPHAYQVSFSTAKAGGAGVRVKHALSTSWSMVEVLPGPAIGRVELECAPKRVRVGEDVRCAVVPRDRFGNAADVEKPTGAPASYFSVARTGGAGEVVVQDASVSFAAAQVGRAGVAVTLDGVRVQDDVEVVADVV